MTEPQARISSATASGLSRRGMLFGVGVVTGLVSLDAIASPAAEAAGPAVPGWILWNHPFTTRQQVFPGGQFGSLTYCSYWGQTNCPTRASAGLDAHTGVDYSPSAGTPIYSVAAGTVALVSNAGSWGYHVEIDHGGGCRTTYCHMQAGSIPSAIFEGNSVGAAQLVGNVGNTGSSYGAHLHLVMTMNGALRDSHEIVGGAPLAGSPGAPFTNPGPRLPRGERDMATGFLRDPVSGNIFKVESTLGGKVRQLPAAEWYAYYAQGYVAYDQPLSTITALQNANGAGG